MPAFYNCTVVTLLPRESFSFQRNCDSQVSLILSLTLSTCRERFLSAPPVFRQTRKVCSFFNCDSTYSTKPAGCRCEYQTVGKYLLSCKCEEGFPHILMCSLFMYNMCIDQISILDTVQPLNG